MAWGNALGATPVDQRAREMAEAMTTPTIDPAVKAWIAAHNRQLPPAAAGALSLDHAFADWRDVIPRIALPTLVIGGRASFFPWRSQAWIAAQIAGARLAVFEADEGGGHVPFIENPAKFNRLIADFVG